MFETGDGMILKQLSTEPKVRPEYQRTKKKEDKSVFLMVGTLIKYQFNPLNISAKCNDIITLDCLMKNK